MTHSQAKNQQLIFNDGGGSHGLLSISGGTATLNSNRGPGLDQHAIQSINSYDDKHMSETRAVTASHHTEY